MSDAQKEHGQAMARKVFQALHGMYGNSAFNRFAIGAMNDQGEDKGVVSARNLWANALANVPVDLVLMALAKCQDKHVAYAPNLPEFQALIKSLMPSSMARSEYTAPRPKLGFTPALRAAEFDKIREMLKAANAKAMGRNLGGAEGSPA
jgi:hypothetical protein